METLYNRLILILKDKGGGRYPNKELMAITGLSSGRITQLKNDETGAGMGGDALMRLVKLGYSPDWITEGRGPMHHAIQGDVLPPAPQLDADEAAMLASFRALPAKDRARALLDLEYKAKLAALESAADPPQELPAAKQKAA